MTNLAIFLIGLLSLSVGLWLVHPAAPFIATGAILLAVWVCTLYIAVRFPAPPKPETTEGK